MNHQLTSTARANYYRAALIGLQHLDASERTARRFGVNADARWEGFAGHLGYAERLDLLIRDAAVQWGTAFSASSIFDLPGLAEDEPFGPDWDGMPEIEAKRLWQSAPAGNLDSAAEALGITAADVALPDLVPSTRLVVAGCHAIRAAAVSFQARSDLSWSAQVVVVADAPVPRQFAGLIAPLLQATEPTRILRPVGDASSAVRTAGFRGTVQTLASADASQACRAFLQALGLD